MSSSQLLEKRDHKLTRPQTDMFDDIASDMALVHNLIVRGLNAVYLQAPHIRPADESSFVRFMAAWHTMVHIHHTNEETDFFPAIEELAGAKGIMEANVEQHHEFDAGLKELKAFIDDVQGGKRKYDGAEVVRIIDGFGQVLISHLADEIQTLLGLRAYGEDKMKAVTAKLQEDAEKGMVCLDYVSLSLASYRERNADNGAEGARPFGHGVGFLQYRQALRRQHVGQLAASTRPHQVSLHDSALVAQFEHSQIWRGGPERHNEATVCGTQGRVQGDELKHWW